MTVSALILSALCFVATAQERPQEIQDRIVAGPSSDHRVALTLDACSGRFDEPLVEFLIRNRIPATIFATKKCLDRNPRGMALLRSHLDLFEIEDHGENHIPAVLGACRKVYGIPGEPDVLHLHREVLKGAQAVEEATGVPAHWYRGATGQYDQKAADEIRRLGFNIAGFSVNADAGATLFREAIAARARFAVLRRGAESLQPRLQRNRRWIVFSVRFMYGLRTAGPIALGMARVPWPDFVVFNALGAAVWAVVFTGLGYAFGRAIAVRHRRNRPLRDACCGSDCGRRAGRLAVAPPPRRRVMRVRRWCASRVS